MLLYRGRRQPEDEDLGTPMGGRKLLGHFAKLVEQAGGDEVIFDRIADGEPARTIAGSFKNPDTGQPFSRGMIYSWIKAGGEARDRLWQEAKALAAHSHAEEAGEILEDGAKVIGLTQGQASMIQHRAKHKRWMAEVMNRAEYGTEKGGGNVINIGTLHLAALQQAGSEDALRLSRPVAEADSPAVEPVEADFEVVVADTEPAQAPGRPQTGGGDDISDLLAPPAKAGQDGG